MKKKASKTWVYIVLALVAGLTVGSLITRWHYKNLYKHSVVCETTKFYDKTGKSLLYALPACNQ